MLKDSLLWRTYFVVQLETLKFPLMWQVPKISFCLSPTLCKVFYENLTKHQKVFLHPLDIYSSNMRSSKWWNTVIVCMKWRCSERFGKYYDGRRQKTVNLVLSVCSYFWCEHKVVLLLDRDALGFPWCQSDDLSEYLKGITMPA